MVTQEVVSEGPEQTEVIARNLAVRLEAGDVVALVGELGAGKTRFVQGMAKGLGVSGYVRSPSFTLINEYLGTEFTFYHADLYRLSEPQEINDIGLEECIGASGVTAIEWADRAPFILPVEHVRVEIDLVPECSYRRLLRMTAYGDRLCRLIEGLGQCEC